MGSRKAKTAPAGKAGKPGKPAKDAKPASQQITKEMGVGEFFETVYPTKARWSTMAVFAVVCISFTVVASVLYNKDVNVDYQSVETQFDKLRHAIADVCHHDEFHRALPPQTASEAGKLKSYIDEQIKTFAKRKTEYTHLYTLGTRTHRSWLAHTKNTYYLSKGKKTWYDAEKFCMSRESHLTSILSEEEQKFITSQIKHPIWIGLTDEKEKGIWKWTDSSGFTIQYWSNVKPKHPPYSMKIEYHCASLSPSATTYNWIQVDCYTLKRWVCKRSLEVQDN